MYSSSSSTPKNPTVIKCAIYTRVSTDSQVDVVFNSCEAQEDRIRSFIDSQDNFKVVQVYSDAGYTGANLNRPALKQMLAAIQSGQVDMVITYKIDRLTRSPRDFYELIELFEKNGASFISVTERFDTSTPSGRLLRNIMLTFAQFERELASERVKDKVVQRVNRGLYHGGHPPFGYRAENAALVFDPPRDAQVKSIFETYVKTHSIRAVLHMLKAKEVVSRKGNPFCDSAIWNMLRNEVYAGKIVHKGVAHPGCHPAIVSDAMFRHVQKMMGDAPRREVDSHAHLPFAGIIKCGECGSTMSVAFTNKGDGPARKRYYYYRCTRIGHRGWDACRTKQINADRLHGMVYNNLLRISMDTDYLKNLVFSLQNQTSRPGGSCDEPEGRFRDLTAENVQKGLTAFINSCARKTGIEKSVEVRGGVKAIRYSQKSVGLDVALRLKKEVSSVDIKRNGKPFSASGFGSEDPVPGAALPPAPKSNEPNRLTRLGSSVKFVSQQMAEGVRFELTRSLRPYRISSAADSTALPSLQKLAR
jgi:site-specific DNA recombinase